MQSSGAFSYVLTMPAAAPTATPSPTPTTVATEPAAPGATASQLVTWTCTGSPCTWGSTTSNPAVVWSATLAPTTMRLGYTTSAGVYVPASAAAGMGIAIAAGTATVYAGLPEASSHRQLASLGAGQSYVITGLAAGEVVSVQSSGAFSYVLTMPAVAPSPTPTPVATEPAAPGAIAAQMVTWTCTGSPCTWGSTTSNPAVVWPAALAPTTMRLGYTTSAGVYVPASAARGDGDRDCGGDGDRVCRAA